MQLLNSSSVRSFLGLDSSRHSTTTTDEDSDEAYASQVRRAIENGIIQGRI